MTLAIIEKLLEDRIGLSADTIGSDMIAKAVQKRRQSCKIRTIDQYLVSLQNSEDEWNKFVETVLVPETWFFRHENAFRFLAEYIRTEWVKGRTRRMLRLLSVPCSSGEEPYSIAMTLLDSGLSQEEFQLDAVDLSRKTLQKAREGVYGRESFRGAQDFSFRDRFFVRHGMLYQIHQKVKDAVHFTQGNVLELEDWSTARPYDVIFCRNVLIYLGQAAKTKVVQTLDRLLADRGIMFVGHAERPVFRDLSVEWLPQSGVFACRRVKSERVSLERKPPPDKPPCRSSQAEPVPLPPEKPQFERRRTERFITKPDAPRSADNAPEATPYTGIDRRKAENENAKLLDTARLFADRGKLTEALENCDRVIKKEPANVQAYFLKGLIFQAQRNDRWAEEFFNKTLYLDPRHSEALDYLLLIAEQRGDREKVRRLKQRIERIQEK